MSLTMRIMQSITIFFLNSSRFLITFIHPVHRKKIEESMKGVNMVIVEEKYFWKMYDFSAKNTMEEGIKNSGSTYVQNEPGTPKSQSVKKMKESTWEAKSTR